MLIALSIGCALSLAAAGLLLRFTLRVRAELRAELAAVQSELDRKIEALEARFDALETQRREQAEWAAQTDSLHLNKQGQVLRLYRRGDAALDIARSLQMAPGEVALLIKVHELQKNPQTSF